MSIKRAKRYGLTVYRVYYKGTPVAEFLSESMARDYLNRLNNTIARLRG